MTVIRCENCKGAGRVEQEYYQYQGILPLPQKGMYGMTVDRLNQINRDTVKCSKTISCPVCGGSGCKWEEEQKG